MLGKFFKKKDSSNGQKKGKPKALPPLVDLDQNPLQEGDLVQALRYDLGKSKIVMEDDMIYYESLESGERVSWVKMIDAATEFQKVKKLSS
ncbi:MAG TPA: hypothetical protein DCS93_18060 [Microscillaceae bacterium]|nr:hypothetical protein [Microscillaceae bacterium]